MTKLQEIAKVLHKFHVGRAMKNQLIEDHFKGDIDEIFLLGPMDIERRIAGIIVSELETPKGSAYKIDKSISERTKDGYEILDKDTVLKRKEEE